MLTRGKLFFDFAAPLPPAGTHWDEATLKLMHDAVEKEIDLKDPWYNGNNVRNQWLDLWDVPSNHGAMLAYLNLKLADLPYAGDVEAVEDPPQPIAYCYTGDKRICYHPHTIKVDGQNWIVNVQAPIYIVIVLSYETTCFPIPTP